MAEAKKKTVSDSLTIKELFDSIPVGWTWCVSYDSRKTASMRTEAARRNREARLTGELKTKLDIKYRVSASSYPGQTALIRLK